MSVGMGVGMSVGMSTFPPPTSTQPITVLCCALGGEGGGVLSEWLYTLAASRGHSAQSTSIPGVAQRTGATTYYVEICPVPSAALGPGRPVFSLNPVPGAIDLLVSSEMLETVRQVGNGMASRARTHVISSNARALTVIEKMQPTDGRINTGALLAVVQAQARQVDIFDMTALAKEAGTVISAVMFGAIAASGRLPFDRQAFEAVVRGGGRAVQASLRGFDLGYAALQPAPNPVPLSVQADAPKAPTPALASTLKTQFPAASHELLAHAHARLIDYQDKRYAALYIERLARVLAAETIADNTDAHGHAITLEMTRWLALWMAFDDIVRVAELKRRASRAERVRREVAARGDEIVKVFDHFKPGVPEFAALLPATLAAKLSAWDKRRVARGQDPWALPLKIGSHTVMGALALALLSKLKGQRVRGSRYVLEQQLIERWLGAVEKGAREDWSLGHELAQCGRLIKGYGSTNERGKEALLHIVEHLAFAATMPQAAARAAAVRTARTAALGDDMGSALDVALKTLGAPPRALRVQPVRWFRRRPDTP